MRFSHDAPPGIDSKTLEVPCFGKDLETNEDIECRVSHRLLINRFSADDATRVELLRAFSDGRDILEDIAERKYMAGRYRRTDDHILIRLDSEDSEV